MSTTVDALLQNVFETVADVFQADLGVMTAATVAADINGWDSVTHTILILEIERRFDLELPLEATYQFRNLGELASFISGRQGSSLGGGRG